MRQRLTFTAGILLGALLISWLDQDLSVTLSTPEVVSRLVEETPVPEAGYDSELTAVIAASNRFNADSIRRNREHVGAVLRCGQGVYYTHGVGADHQAPVEFTVAKPKRCRLLALWHTHGAEAPDRNFFSPADTQSADRLRVPIYMTNHTGLLKVYRPGGRKLAVKGSRFGLLPIPRGTAEGKVVKDSNGAPIIIQTTDVTATTDVATTPATHATRSSANNRLALLSPAGAFNRPFHRPAL